MAQWLEACGVNDVELEGVIRFGNGERTFAADRPDHAAAVSGSRSRIS